MIVGSTAEWPKIFTIFFADGQIVDARDASSHQPMLVEFPVFVAIGSEPIAAVIMTLVSKPDSDAVLAKRPDLFDKPVIKFFGPLTGEKLNDFFAAVQKFRTIAPDAVYRVSSRDFFRIATVPGVLGETDFFDRRVMVERRERRALVCRWLLVSC